MSRKCLAPVLLLAVLAGPALAQPATPGLVGAVGGTPGVTVADLFDPQRPGVLIAAHRANSGRWLARAIDWAVERDRGPAARAENSLAAIDAAIAAGAHIVEVDVRHTRDGQLVLMHDAEVDRTTDGKGKVEDLTLAEVRRLRLVPQGQVPTLEEALDRARGRCVVDIDLKTSRVDLVVAAVQRARAHDYVLLFDGPDTCRRVKQLDPALEVMPRAHGEAEALALLADPLLRPRVVHVDVEDLDSAALRAAARAAGARLWINALGPKDVLALRWAYRKLIRRGAGVIQTDRPECVARAAR